MTEFSRIYFDGLERYIVSYESLLFKEPGNLELGAKCLSPHQYLSCLFNNLGYDKCPKDFLWMENNLDIVNVPKSEVFDYPITRNCLMIRNNCTLFDLLLCIRNWIKSGIEKGRLLDPRKSFKMPSQKDIQFNIQNRMKIYRTSVLQSRPVSWDKSDIFWRRLYNLNPCLDKDYFESCLVNFESYARQIRIQDPQAIFVSVLVDPNILLSVIKQSEIEATNNVFIRQNNVYSKVLLNEKDVAIEFEKILIQKLMKLSVIFRYKGPRGFISKQYKIEQIVPARPIMGIDITLIPPYIMNRPDLIADQIMLGEVFKQIANIPLNDETKSFITKYIDSRSLQFIDKFGIDNPYRLATYKRLYYTIEQLKNCHEELINSKDKFIMSESFYIDPDRFGLYSKSLNKFYIAGLDLILREMSPQEAISYYEYYLGKEVMLDPNEVGILEAEMVPLVDIDLLFNQSFEQMNIDEPVPISANPNVYQPVTIINPPQEEYYGWNSVEMVNGF